MKARTAAARLRAALTTVRRWGGASMAAALAAANAEATRRQVFVDALLDTVDVGIVSCDADGVLFLSNRTEREMFGLESTLDGQPMGFLERQIDVFDRDGRRLGVEDYPLLRTLRGEDVSNLEVLAGPAGGPYRELLVQGRQIMGPDGRVVGAVAALTDVTTERAAGRRLAEQHRQLSEAQRVGQLGSFECDLRDGSWAFSENLAELWGLEPSELSPESMTDLIVAEDVEAARQCWRRARREGGSHSAEVRIRRGTDGSARVLRMTVEADLDHHGEAARCRGTHLDITELRSAEHAVRQANSFLSAVMAASPDFTFVADVTSREVIYTSPHKDAVGVDGDRLAAGGIRELVASAHPADRDLLEATLTDATALGDGEVVQVKCRVPALGDEGHWLNYRLTPFQRDSSGQVVQVLAVVRNISDMVAAEERLLHAARHDHLTGLPNRALLMERLDAALKEADVAGHQVAVLFCDLDGFKDVNDTGGHAVGDAVLQVIARRLATAVRDSDTVARVGGDEFLIVIEPWNRDLLSGDEEPGGRSLEELSVKVAERVREELLQPIHVAGREYSVTVSIGIAMARPPATADDLLNRADEAMYRTKGLGKDGFSLY